MLLRPIDTLLRAVVAEQPCPLLFAAISGVHLYGFPSPDSDYDLRGVHVLPLREVVGLGERRETLEVSADRDGLELDLVTHDVAKFCRLLLLFLIIGSCALLMTCTKWPCGILLGCVSVFLIEPTESCVWGFLRS